MPYRIVGVVDGTKTITIGEEQQPQFYEPLDQIVNDRLRIQFVLRSAIPPALQLDAVRRTLHRLEPMAGAQVETMYSSIGLAFLPSQVGAVLLGSIGILGPVLAMIGLYGVMVYSVVRRTREIAVRIAIGATRGNILRMILGDSARLTLAGSLVGLFVALFVTKPLAAISSAGPQTRRSTGFRRRAAGHAADGYGRGLGTDLRRAISIDPNAACVTSKTPAHDNQTREARAEQKKRG